MSNLSAWLAVGLLLLGCAASQDQGALVERMRCQQTDLAGDPSDSPAPLSSDDLDLLESVKIDTSSFTTGDVAMLVKVFRFGRTLGDSDWKSAADYAASEKGRSLAWPLMILLVDRGDLDGAARLAIASLADAAEENRSYSMWKFWETAYGARDDASQLRRDFALALLRCRGSGGDPDKQIVADIFSREKITDADVPVLRKQIEQTCLDELAYREQALLGSGAGRWIWIEDRKGLRQAPRTPSMDIQWWEIRLGARIQGQDPLPPWGTLLNIYDDSLQAELDILRRLAVDAQQDLGALDAGVGPIAKIRRPGSEPGPFWQAIHELDGRMTAALAAGGFSLLLAEQDVVRAAGHGPAGRALAKQSLAVVRRAATRLRTWTEPNRSEDSLDQDGRAELIAELDNVTRSVAKWVGGVLVGAPAADGGSWRDMRLRGPRGLQDMTLVRIGADRVMILEIGSREGASDVPGIYHDLMVCELTREDLRKASFRVEGEGGATLAIDSAQPLEVQWLSLPPSDGSDFQIDLVGKSAVRGGSQAVRVRCDSLQHARDLAEQLRRFVAGTGR